MASSSSASRTQKLRDQNVRLVGELLVALNRPKVAHINYVDVVAELAACATKGSPVALYAAGFASHERNLRGSQLSEMVGRVELTKLWDTLGKDGGLKAYFGTLKPKSTGEAASRKLDSFMEDRNQIIHRGPSYQTVGATIVLDYVEYFRVLAPALAKTFEHHLASY